MNPTPKLKALVVVLTLLLYVYVLLSIKTYYMKSKRLDELEEMVLLTEKKIQNVREMDQKLGQQLAQMDKLYEGY